MVAGERNPHECPLCGSELHRPFVPGEPALVDCLDEGRWFEVSKQLSAHPQVVKTGERRGTRYQWGGGEA